MILIDFEYTFWNPRAMDLANYFNETMLDNAYPLGNGIKCYLQNFITDKEQEFLMRRYLSEYYDKFFKGNKDEVSRESLVEKELPKLTEEVRRCLLLNNYFWAVWALRMLKKDKLEDDKVFNFDFAEARIKMFNHVKRLYYS